MSKLSTAFKHWFKTNTVYMNNPNGGKQVLTYSGIRKKDPILLQWWGTEFRRAQDSNYWIDDIEWDVKAMYANARHANKPEPNIVISDMRFINEAELIQSLGGEIWNIKRLKVIPDTQDCEDYIATGRDPNHPSECELDGYKFDQTLFAVSGNVASLYEQVNTLLF